MDFDELPTVMNNTVLENIAKKTPEKAVLIPHIITIMEAKGNDQNKLSGAFEALSQKGINGTDVYKYNYFDENHNPITLYDALNALRTSKTINIESKTPEQLDEQKKMLRHVEKYGLTTGIDSRTHVASFPGVTGVGISARTAKTMDSMDGQGAFYGGLDVNSKIKEQLETQNALYN